MATLTPSCWETGTYTLLDANWNILTLLKLRLNSLVIKAPVGNTGTVYISHTNDTDAKSYPLTAWESVNMNFVWDASFNIYFKGDANDKVSYLIS